MISKDFSDLPLQAPFFALSSLRMTSAGIAARAAAAALEAAEQALRSSADTIEAAQEDWQRRKRALDNKAWDLSG